MTRNSDEQPFYVVQFLNLPYEGIDDYVCIPHTWVIVLRTPSGQSVVCYPNDKDPSLIRDRAKRKERCNNEWKFYMAAVKHQSNSYQNAELWIASRKDHRPLEEIETRRIPDTQPESTPNLNSRNSAQGDSSKLLIQTDTNTESKREQSTSIQDNQSTRLAQTQETATASNINFIIIIILIILTLLLLLLTREPNKEL